MRLRKNIPDKIKQKAPPKESSLTPNIPFYKNTEESPKIVSDPNQVVNKAEADRKSGSERPANTKSFDPLSSRKANAPTSSVNIK